VNYLHFGRVCSPITPNPGDSTGLKTYLFTVFLPLTSTVHLPWHYFRHYNHTCCSVIHTPWSVGHCEWITLQHNAM